MTPDERLAYMVSVVVGNQTPHRDSVREGKRQRRTQVELLHGQTQRQEEYASPTLLHGGSGSYLAGTLAQTSPEENAEARSAQAAIAGAASWGGVRIENVFYASNGCSV